MINRKIVSVLMLLVVSQLPAASKKSRNHLDLSGVTLGTPVMAGTGCRLGSALVLDVDRNELIILMDDYYVEAYDDVKIARKNCALSIPVHLPRGIKMSVIGQRIEGFNYLPEGASSVLTTETFIAGSTGEPVSERFEGELIDNFAVETAALVHDDSLSVSGKDFNLRVNTALRVRTNHYGDYAVAGVTALGAKSKSIVYSLEFAPVE